MPFWSILPVSPGLLSSLFFSSWQQCWDKTHDDDWDYHDDCDYHGYDDGGDGSDDDDDDDSGGSAGGGGAGVGGSGDGDHGGGGDGGGGGDDIKEVTHRAAGGLFTSGKKQPGQLDNLTIGQLDNDQCKVE